MISNLKKLTKNCWITILMEFLERGSFYGVMSILAIYLTMEINQGGLGFAKESVGIIRSVTMPLLFILPIISGAISDRFGYRKTLFFASVVMSVGYLLCSIFMSYGGIFLALLLVTLGAGFFKPVASGTIARETNEETSGFAFGIFYWAINLGAFIFPLLFVTPLKSIKYNYVFLMASVATFLIFFLNLIFYKEPVKVIAAKKSNILKEIVFVLKDVKFIILILVYSLFWILYFQMFDAVLWYLKEHLNMQSVNNFVNSFLSLFISNANWKFDSEHVTVINAGTIICLQVVVSNIVNKLKPLPTMIFGILLGVIGVIIIGLFKNPWLFILGLIIFSLGEMIAHPKFISYIGLIAPEDKKALYLGYSFLYGVIGSGVGGILGAFTYVHLVNNLQKPILFWLLFAAIGLLSAIGLLIINKLFNKS